ncbi:MAG: DUF2156 domain-containing protein [Thermoanaerobaculia bacterium]|nr:DUF2156 domain-containing protein [Thermoanaerobaculia bacterium]
MINLSSTPAANPLQRARELVLQFGRNATSYQILNPGLELWFSRQHPGVVGFVETAGGRVVAGEPVGPFDDVEEIATEFETASEMHGSRVCYFGAEEPLAHGPRVDRLLLGAQPTWRPTSWPGILQGKSSLRAQLARARNKGLEIKSWSSTLAAGHPELERCLGEWLATRGLPPMHFLVQPRTLERLFDRLVFVATADARPVGFLIASPVRPRNGWLIEQIVRGTDAPNGTSELLIDAVMRHLISIDAQYVTLGLSPLSRRSGLKETTARWWIRFLLGWVRAHGRRFYDFEGLDFFKSKLQPESWEPIYAVARDRHLGLRDLYAIAGAFSGTSPVTFFARGLVRAVRIEWSRLHKYLSRRWSLSSRTVT